MIFDEDVDKVSSNLTDKIKDLYQIKTDHEEPEHLDGLERSILLGSIDRLWQEHLFSMDSLRESVSLRAQAQKDPLVEYKNEAFGLFEELLSSLKVDVAKVFSRMVLQPNPNSKSAEPNSQPTQNNAPITKKIPRNAPCPCGSGKKFKKCCGAL